MTTDTGMPMLRSVATGGDTETILSYYQSDLAGQPYMISDRKGDQQVTTRASTGTRLAGSSNDSSHLSPGMTTKKDSFGSPAVHRRKHSNNAEDNRRVAIVPIQVDLTRPGPAPGDETGYYMPTTSNVATTLPLPLAGRGSVVDAQLAASGSALVAPPDTNNLFSLHDPTSSSPPPTTPKNRSSPSSTQPAKSRSRAKIGHSKSSSRDIGIVGTRRDLAPQDLATISQDTPSDFEPPIFQTPTLRSSSPPSLITPVDTIPGESNSSAQNGSLGTAHARPAAMSASVEPVPNMSSAMNGHGGHAPPHSAHSLAASSLRHQPVGTADQGQSSPSSPTTKSAAPSSYLYYQPGVHSKAGPLPPPPRAMFDIDFNGPPPPRPPRLRSPSPLNTKKGGAGSTTPASVTVRLTSKASSPSIHQIRITTTPPVDTETSSESSSYSS
ncbi:hypothetical protein BJV78DRAFT_775092 [Lactifluus subvellereus]|nr:hypothetical protein BJV78DRAFT_775092 [Lactifluus subvellereus]